MRAISNAQSNTMKTSAQASFVYLCVNGKRFSHSTMTEKNIYRDILFGVAVGDALGVPVEFKSRQTIAQKPVTDMIGYGTYDLPPGTFSDDSSLSFCLA